MSDRAGGSPLWLIRPVIDGVIDEARATLFAGTLEAAIIEANWREALTGLQHAVTEVRS